MLTLKFHFRPFHKDQSLNLTCCWIWWSLIQVHHETWWLKTHDQIILNWETSYNDLNSTFLYHLIQVSLTSIFCLSKLWDRMIFKKQLLRSSRSNWSSTLIYQSMHMSLIWVICLWKRCVQTQTLRISHRWTLWNDLCALSTQSHSHLRYHIRSHHFLNDRNSTSIYQQMCLIWSSLICSLMIRWTQALLHKAFYHKFQCSDLSLIKSYEMRHCRVIHKCQSTILICYWMLQDWSQLKLQSRAYQMILFTDS